MRTAIYGHTSPETAYLVADYPYGFRARCQIRYWLESNKKGVRFCSQTTNPKTDRWNKPKCSTYALVAACMYLDENNHVQWSAITEYTEAKHVLNFIKDFPGSDLAALKLWCDAKVRFGKARADGAIKWTVNGEVKEDSQSELDRITAETKAWEDCVSLLG